MAKKTLNATEALVSVADSDGDSTRGISAFTCPHSDCGAHAVHRWGTVHTLQIFGDGDKNARLALQSPKVIYALCEACNKEVIFINGKLTYPDESEAPSATADMPLEIMADYNEARSIVQRSPRGAAALLRLAIQKLLPILGSSKKDINSGIGELVEKGVITPAIQQALDSVRVIGNESVHPGELDLKDDVETAFSLFQLINFIVEKAITEPKEVAAIYAKLPAAKLAGIAARDNPSN